MKAFNRFSLFVICIVFSFPVFAQQLRTDSIPVSGNCEMCKARIEKAAALKGVEQATWDEDSKVLVVKYNSLSVNAAKIQRAVAAVGYDTRDVKASEAAYKKLPGCCQYDRESPKAACCKEGKCSKPGHDGKDCCKESHLH